LSGAAVRLPGGNPAEDQNIIPSIFPARNCSVPVFHFFGSFKINESTFSLFLTEYSGNGILIPEHIRWFPKVRRKRRRL